MLLLLNSDYAVKKKSLKLNCYFCYFSKFELQGI